jgi:hypothetical protein
VVKLERIRAALPSAAAWRNETEPDTAERYARTAAKLAALLREVSDGDDDAGDRFALASALWKFSGDFHAGQFSGLYRVGCVISADPIRFRPGMSGAVSWEPFGPERHLYRHFRKVWNRSESRGVDLAERAAVVLCILCADETEGGDE